MAHFLRGKFRGFYKAGSSECVRDVFRFKGTGNNKITFEMTRRDVESLMHRFWRYEHATMKLTPADEAQPRLGGSVEVSGLFIDFQTLTMGRINQHGIYTDDMVTFGTFDKEAGNPAENEELLLKVTEDVGGEHSPVVDKVTFKFEGDQLSFARAVNEEKSDAEVNHAIEESPLDTMLDESWTEALFYGRGNKAM